MTPVTPRALAGLAGAALLTACGSPPTTYYRPAVAPAAPAAEPLGLELRFAGVEAEGRLGTAIAWSAESGYRVDDGRSWIAPPAVIVEAALADRLFVGRGLRRTRSREAPLLEGVLRRFEGSSDGHARVALWLAVTDPAGETVLERTFTACAGYGGGHEGCARVPGERPDDEPLAMAAAMGAAVEGLVDAASAAAAEATRAAAAVRAGARVVRAVLPEPSDGPPAAPADAGPPLRLRTARAADYLDERVVRDAAGGVVAYDPDLRWAERPRAVLEAGLAQVLFREGPLRLSFAGGAPSLEVTLRELSVAGAGEAARGAVALEGRLLDDAGEVLLDRTFAGAAESAAPRPARVGLAAGAALRAALTELRGAVADALAAWRARADAAAQAAAAADAAEAEAAAAEDAVRTIRPLAPGAPGPGRAAAPARGEDERERPGLRLRSVRAGPSIEERVLTRRSGTALEVEEALRWLEPPSALVEAALGRELFEAAPRLERTRSSDSPVLEAVLRAFERVLVPGEPPRVEVVLWVALLDPDQRALHERTYTERQPLEGLEEDAAAATAEATGVALERLVDRVGGDVRERVEAWRAERDQAERR